VLFLTLAPFIFGACQSVPKSERTVFGPEGSAVGQWRGKARVRDLRSAREDIINLDIIAREPSYLRMEITGAFGVHVASIALNENSVSYILTREKKFITAPADSRAIARLVPVRISPSELLALLFDRDLSRMNWTCAADPATGRFTKCEETQQKVIVSWLAREGRKRRFAISAPGVEIDMILDEAKSKVEAGPGAFELSPPEGFSHEKLTRVNRFHSPSI